MARNYQMAIFISSTSVANSIVDNTELHLPVDSLIGILLSNSTSIKNIDLLMGDQKGRIKVYLDPAQYVQTLILVEETSCLCVTVKFFNTTLS